MPDKTTPRPDQGATPTRQEQAERIADAFAADFKAWADTPEVRKILRQSVSGKIKRRTLMELAFATGAAHAISAMRASQPCPDCPNYMGRCPSCGRDGEASS